MTLQNFPKQGPELPALAPYGTVAEKEIHQTTIDWLSAAVGRGPVILKYRSLRTTGLGVQTWQEV